MTLMYLYCDLHLRDSISLLVYNGDTSVNIPLPCVSRVAPRVADLADRAGCASNELCQHQLAHEITLYLLGSDCTALPSLRTEPRQPLSKQFEFVSQARDRRFHLPYEPRDPCCSDKSSLTPHCLSLPTSGKCSFTKATRGY